jgi:hypothetical protein
MNTQASNRLRVLIGLGVPNPDFGESKSNWVSPWPCKKDHDFSHVYRHAEGLRCRACDTERRAADRKKHREREIRRDRERRKRETPEQRRHRLKAQSEYGYRHRASL